MADLLNFSFRSNSFFLQIDPRGKLILLIIFPICSFLLSTQFMLLLSPILFFGIIYTDIKVSLLLKSSIGFFVILLFLPLSVLIRNLSNHADGEIYQALEFSLALLNIYLFSIFIIRITGVRGIQNGITWYLSFVPFIPSRKIGLLIGLTLSTLPQIFSDWNRIIDAQKSRGIESTRNPLRRLASPLFPLFLNTILKSVAIAAALETRGYAETEYIPGRDIRKMLSLKWKLKDTIFLSSVLIVLFLTKPLVIMI